MPVNILYNISPSIQVSRYTYYYDDTYYFTITVGHIGGNWCLVDTCLLNIGTPHGLATGFEKFIQLLSRYYTDRLI